MKLGKWVLGVVAVALLFGGTAMAQIEGNRLCIHNGSEYYTNGPYHGFPNEGGGKLFPAFSHFASTGVTDPTGLTTWPWKISGWAWGGMQANVMGPVWVWHTCLQASVDNPAQPTMSFDYPVLFCTGVVPHTGFPMPIYGGTVPTTVAIVGGRGMIFPSSFGGFDGYLNIFAVGGASWTIPSTQPYYGWSFAFIGPCNTAIQLASGTSIWEYVWAQRGPNSQYLLLSGNESDCLGGGGNKGRNYSIIGDFDNGYLWAWLNQCTGTGVEWSMCLFLCDTISIPYNVPGAPNAANPYAVYGFDVGTGTVTPYLMSGCVNLGFVTEDWTGLNAGAGHIATASFAFWPCIPYGKKGYRVPHGFDLLTNLFLGVSGLFYHVSTFPYPGCMFGSTTGGHSLAVPFPPDPALQCQEIRYATYDLGKGRPMSASYMVTYF
jgi:hypothetical protein